MVTSGMTNW